MSPTIRIIKGNTSQFSPSSDPGQDEIALAADEREYWPEVFAHEDAHRRLGHRDDKDDWEYPVEIFNDEVAAWDLALSRAPSSGFRRSIIHETLKTYLDMIAFQFGTGSRKYIKAKKQFDSLFAKYFGTSIGKHKATARKTSRSIATKSSSTLQGVR